MNYPAQLDAAFRARFGAAPAVIVRAPGRINLIGEHTDYNEGFVMPAAIDKAIYFAISLRTDDRLEWEAFDFQESYTGSVRDIRHADRHWPNYLLGVVQELQALGLAVQGFNVVFGGDIPAGAGLSSSAAVESGLVQALNHLHHWNLPDMEMVRLAQRSENNFVGLKCGIMDMFASQMGRRHCMIRLDCRSLEYTYFPFEAPDYQLVLCDTGVKHSLASSAYNTRRQECEEGVRLLATLYPGLASLRGVSSADVEAARELLPEVVYRRCRHVTGENERVMAMGVTLEQGDFEAVGRLLYASHDSLRHDYEVSCAELDFLVDQARTLPYVAGGRMMGGGFGGCTINLVQKNNRAEFESILQERYAAAFGRDLLCYEVEPEAGVNVISI